MGNITPWACAMTEIEPKAKGETMTKPKMEDVLQMAERFHEAYERLAPLNGYETRTETRKYDPHSPNGMTMMAVCAELMTPPEGVPEFDCDEDGELLMDWSPSDGRMVSLSLRSDGRLSYAISWDGETSHGTAQMPQAGGEKP
jgi:hypothetical protein